MLFLFFRNEIAMYLYILQDLIRLLPFLFNTNDGKNHPIDRMMRLGNEHQTSFSL